MSNRRFPGDNRPPARRLPYLVSLFAYIEGGHCHSKGDRNELPKYLRSPIARFGSILMVKSVTASNIFHHSPERKLNGSSCEELARFLRSTDLDVCVCARGCASAHLRCFS